jgi:hypothetical protein
MKRLQKIPYLYFTIGLTICLYSLISQNTPTLNIHDTYLVFSPKVFAFIVILIYTTISLSYILIEKHLRYPFQLTQFLMFCVPFSYFIFSDLIPHNDPEYYLEHPTASAWETVYTPMILSFSFLVSIITFIGFVIFTAIKMLKTK